MVSNATFNNVSVILWWSVLYIVEGNRSTWRKLPTCRKSLTNYIKQCCIEYTSPWTGFELTILVVIGKSNNHMFTTKTAPTWKEQLHTDHCLMLKNKTSSFTYLIKTFPTPCLMSLSLQASRELCNVCCRKQGGFSFQEKVIKR